MGDEIEFAELAGRRVLIVEDQWLIAMALAEELEAKGGISIGPEASVAAALEAIALSRPDAAILDVGLGETSCFPVADALAAKAVPFIFTTGYAPDELPAEYAKVPVRSKPAAAHEVLVTLCAQIARHRC
jgi:CheY-like chemotaxis protein